MQRLFYWLTNTMLFLSRNNSPLRPFLYLRVQSISGTFGTHNLTSTYDFYILPKISLSLTTSD